MKKLQIHFSDSRKDLPIVKPDEDFTFCDESIFIVADGVTLMWQIPYPDPSPAFLMAKLFCTEVSTYIKENKNLIDKNILLFKAFSKANEEIRKYNEENDLTAETVNYVEKQYASTVGAAGFLYNQTLYIGNINDSGIMVFNEKNDLVINQIADTERHMNYLKLITSVQKFEHLKDQHIYFRKNVVNKHIDFEGEEVNFGVLTGEKEAEDFIVTQRIEIKPGYKAIFYTDGFMPHLNSKEFIENILNMNEENLENYIQDFSNKDQKYLKEKSMILVWF